MSLGIEDVGGGGACRLHPNENARRPIMIKRGMMRFMIIAAPGFLNNGVTLNRNENRPTRNFLFKSSANGALHISLGQRPREKRQTPARAEGPLYQFADEPWPKMDRTVGAYPLAHSTSGGARGWYRAGLWP